MSPASDQIRSQFWIAEITAFIFLLQHPFPQSQSDVFNAVLSIQMQYHIHNARLARRIAQRKQILPLQEFQMWILDREHIPPEDAVQGHSFLEKEQILN